jgi:hypothetical protein
MIDLAIGFDALIDILTNDVFNCGFRNRLCPPWVDEVNKTILHFRVSPAAGINTVLGAVIFDSLNQLVLM